MFAISGNKRSRRIAVKVNEAQCCDPILRQPAECFTPGFKESSANWNQKRHFETNLLSVPTRFIGRFRKECYVQIKRTSNAQKVIRAAGGTQKMHGEFRPEVVRCTVPQVSPVVTTFRRLTSSQQEHMLKDLLTTPIATTCSDISSSTQ